MRPTPRLFLATAVTLFMAGAALPGAQATPRVGSFQATLGPVNQNGSGTVTLDQRGTSLTVHLQAAGLDDGVHVAHIHGLPQARSECPTSALDGNGDGRVDLVEGLPAYGPVQVTLSHGTTDRGSALGYTRIYTHRDSGDAIASLGDLDGYAIVVHGVDLNGDGLAADPDVDGDGTDHDDNEVTMPALCGTIEPER